MYLDVGMDDGDIIQKEVVKIEEEETAGELWDRLSNIGAELLVKTVNDISNGIINRTKQVGDVIIAPKIEKELSRINWNEKNALEINNLIRGLNPGIGVYSILDGKKIKFWKAKVITEKEFYNKYNKKIDINMQNGTVLLSNEKQGLFIKTKEGILSVLNIQGENSKRMSISDYLRGNSIEVGSKFQ